MLGNFQHLCEYLIPLNFRAPFIFAPLIFAHPCFSTIRAPLIFAHLDPIRAPLIFSHPKNRNIFDFGLDCVTWHLRMNLGKLLRKIYPFISWKCTQKLDTYPIAIRIHILLLRPSKIKVIFSIKSFGMASLAQ